MNRKRILLVSLGILGILTVVLGAAGFILTSRPQQKSMKLLTESPPPSPAISPP
jgi:energy-converting hydrogenase Eha subunit C